MSLVLLVLFLWLPNLVQELGGVINVPEVLQTVLGQKNNPTSVAQRSSESSPNTNSTKNSTTEYRPTSPWSEWSSCDKSCGGGARHRFRYCSKQLSSGISCHPTESEGCNFQQCPINGGWTLWSTWQKCNKPCGDGLQFRKRICSNPEPQYGGASCVGKGEESRPCEGNAPCPKVMTMYVIRLLDETWNDALTSLSSPESKNLIQKLRSNVNKYYDGENVMADFVVIQFRPGSVIATFNITYEFVDSLQILKVQEDLTSGKLNNLNAQLMDIIPIIVPSQAPNITYANHISSTGIRIQWTAVAAEFLGGAPLAGYVIFYKETSLKFEQNRQKKVPPGVTQAEINGLKKFFSYTMRVLAYTANGNGIASDPVVISTDEDRPSLEPQNVLAKPQSSTSITVTWDHIPEDMIHGILQGYTIFYRAIDETSFSEMNVGATDIYARVPDLRKYTFYLVSICGRTSKGCGVRSQTVMVRTLDDAPSLPPANAFVQNLTSTTELQISWGQVPRGHVNGDLIGYVLKYKLLVWMDEDMYYEEERERIFGPNDYSTTLNQLNVDGIYRLGIAAFTRIGRGPFAYVYGKTCRCPKVLYTNYWNYQPYTRKLSSGAIGGLFPEIVFKMTEWACGVCTNGHGKTMINTLANGKGRASFKSSNIDLLNDIDDVPEISFPVHGTKYMSKYGGSYKYVHLIDSPGIAFITVAEPPDSSSLAVMQSIFDCFPLLLIALSMAFMAGVVIWILESRDNPEQFPTSFVKGVGEGFWWSFITMTTLGYGDRAPVTILGRLFGIFWTLAGLVVLSVVVGAISSSLATVSMDTNVPLYGTKIAAFQNSSEHQYGVLKNSKMNTEQQYESIEAIQKALVDREVKGALIDTYVAAENKDVLFSDEDITVSKLIDSSFGYGVVLSGAGVFIENRCRDYYKKNRKEIFDLVQSNTDEIEAPAVPGSVQKSSGLFNPNSPLIKMSWLGTSCGLILGILAGLYWHYAVYKKQIKELENKLEVNKEEIEKNLQYKAIVIKELTTMLEDFHSKMNSLEKQRKLHKQKCQLCSKENDVASFCSLNTTSSHYYC
ncbi:uncharacterized protein LOC116305827 isoform X3 [Actinia tenebrosa]|uniref:Uncharacterized protein LOC116305827 isoform X3 n=1 Tax=Actinia tenebrosa TaxID=6105 RepID=A0A6P8J1N1_ACTTE|nr:uncharacterized protein LOC116305827 isoform X3 [Actinia tenebrosa]